MNIEDQRDWWRTQSKDWKALCDFQSQRIYRLKLERLMYKCQHRLTWLSDYVDSAPYGEERDVWEAKYDRCYKIYNGCFNALEVLNK